MKRIQNSPIIGYSLMSKPYPITDQQPDPVQVLQLKLQTLEQKYLNFVERCSDLLKSEKLSTEAKDLISSCSSSHCYSPNPQTTYTRDTQQLLELLSQLENGELIKQLMANVSNIVQTSQNSIFRQFTFPDKVKKGIQESQKALTAEIWQSLFTYETYVQSAVKSSIKKIQDLDKAFEGTTSLLKLGSKEGVYKEKYQKCKLKNENLMKRLKDSAFGKVVENTQQSLANSRSLVASPAPYSRQTAVSANRVMESSVKSGGKMKTVQLDLKKGDSYEVEKREIQDQLKNLQQKLQGFEKIAKNLIDSSIRAELNIIGKKQTDVSKSKVYESPDLSIFGSHISLLDADQLQKTVEVLEKEKEELTAVLQEQKDLGRELELENSELSQKVKRLSYECERISEDYQKTLKDLLKEKEKKMELEEKIRDTEGKVMGEKERLEKAVVVLNENKKMLSDKVKEKDKIIDELTVEINSSKVSYSAVFEKNKGLKAKIKKIKEEKLKIMTFSAKHAENAKNFEENLRVLEENLKQSQENEKELISEAEKWEEKCNEFKKLLDKALEREKMLKEKFDELKGKGEDWVKQLRIGKEEKESLEKLLEKLKKTVESLENEKQKQLNVQKTLEKTLENKEDALKTSEIQKKIIEKKLKENLSSKESEKSKEASDEFKKKELFIEIEKLEQVLKETQEKNDNLSNFNQILHQTIKDQKEAISNLESTINSLEASNKTFEDSIEALESQLKLQESTNKSLQSSLEYKEKRIQDLESTFSTLKQEVSSSQTLQSDFFSLKSALSLSQSAETLLKSQILDLNTQLSIQDSLKSELYSLKTEYEHSQSQIKTLESQLASKELQLKQRSSALSEAQIQLSSSESTVNTLQLDLKSTQIQIDSLQKRLEKLPELQSKELILTQDLQNAQKTVKSLQNELTDAKQTLVQLAKVENGLRDKLENMKSENEELLMTLSSRSEALVTLKGYVKQIRIDLKSVKTSELKAGIAEIKGFVLKKTEEFKNFVQNPYNLKYFENFIQDFKSSVQGLTVQNSGLYLTIQKLNTKHEQMLNESNQKTQELHLVLSQNSSLEAKLRSAEQELKESQKNSVLKTEGLERKLKDCAANEASMLISLQKLQTDKEGIIIDLKKKEENCKELEKTVEGLRGELKKLLEAKEYLSTDLEVFDLKINEKIKQIIVLTEQKEALEAKLLDLEDIKKSVETEKNNQILALTEQIHVYQKQLIDFEDLQEKIKINTKEFFQTDQENQQLHNKLEAKHKELEKTSESLLRTKQDLEKVIKDYRNLSAENQRLIEIQSSQSTGAKAAKDALEAKETEIKHLEAALADQIHSAEDLKSALFETQAKLSSLKSFPNTHCENCSSKPQKFSESSEKSAFPLPIKSKTGSIASNIDPSSVKQSIYTEELNITPCKLLKTVNYKEKKWVLVQNEEGSYLWKEDFQGVNSKIHEEFEDLDEIKIALAEWYKGSIIEAIEELKSKVGGVNYSFQGEDKFEMLSQSFKGEIFEAGLELSKIDIRVPEIENFEQSNQELAFVTAELAVKNKKIEKKKRTLLLHKEQIVVLKEQIRKYQEKVMELEGMAGVDLTYLKQVYMNLIGKIKADKAIEDLILVLFKILRFTPDEISKIQARRKGVE